MIKQVRDKYGITKNSLYCPELLLISGGAIPSCIFLTYLIAQADSEGKLKKDDSAIRSKLGFTPKQLKHVKSKLCQPITEEDQKDPTVIVWTKRGKVQILELNLPVILGEKPMTVVKKVSLPKKKKSIAQEIEEVARKKQSQNPNYGDIYTYKTEQRHWVIDHMVKKKYEFLLNLVVGIPTRSSGPATAPKHQDWESLVLYAGEELIQFERPDLLKQFPDKIMAMKQKAGRLLLEYLMEEMCEHDSIRTRNKGRPGKPIARFKTWIRNHTRKGYAGKLRLLPAKEAVQHKQNGMSTNKVFDGTKWVSQ